MGVTLSESPQGTLEDARLQDVVHLTLTMGQIEALLIDEPKPAVLFLCVHNAGRSQMAAGWKLSFP